MSPQRDTFFAIHGRRKANRMKEKLENNLDSESYELISESKTSTEFKLKFKLLEVFSHNGLFTAKN